MLNKVIMIAVLLVSLADGCEKAGNDEGKEPPYNQGPANVHCSVRADYPHWSSGSPDWIDGKVWVTCAGATIEKLTVEAKLQRLENGKWNDLLSSMPLSQTFAPANAGQRYGHMATFPCGMIRAGDVFRTAGRGSGTFGGRPAGSATWTYNPEAGKEVRCRK